MTTATRAARRKKGLISLRHNGLRMTPEEFDAIDDWDELYSYELINGVLIVNAMPSRFERDPNEELGHWLRSFQEEHPGVINKTLFEEYIRTPNGRRRADRAIWAGYGAGFDLDRDLPTIVVEFVSKRRRDWVRDYVEKRDEYLSLGIREYWVINRFQGTLTVFRKSAAGVEEQVVSDKETFRSPLLPGFDLSVGKLLSVSEEWRK